MKKALVLFAALTVAFSSFAQTYVKPHIRKDGTYVEGHVRSAPNNSNLDNYGTRGNVNPHTGQQGTQQPNYFPQPTYQAPSYQQPRQQQCGPNAQGFYVCR